MSQYQPYQPGETAGQNFEHQQLQPYSQHSAPVPYVHPSVPYAQSAPQAAYGQPMYVLPPELKSTGVAYVFAVFLGQFGAHNFYLGRTGAAVGQLVLWLFGVLTTWLIIGGFMLLALVIWWIVDLCTIPGHIRAINERRLYEFNMRNGHYPQSGYRLY